MDGVRHFICLIQVDWHRQQCECQRALVMTLACYGALEIVGVIIIIIIIINVHSLLVLCAVRR